MGASMSVFLIKAAPGGNADNATSEKIGDAHHPAPSMPKADGEKVGMRDISISSTGSKGAAAACGQCNWPAVGSTSTAAVALPPPPSNGALSLLSSL